MFSNDHSPIFSTFSLNNNFQKGRGFCKLLVLHENFVDQIRNHTQVNKKQLVKELSFFNDQVMREF